MRPRGSGRTNLAVVALIAGLLGIGCRSEPEPKPTAVPPPPARDAAVPIADAAVASLDALAVDPDRWILRSLSLDGQRALLSRAGHGPPHYRVFVIATGALETDVELTAHGDLHFNFTHPAVVQDLARARTLLQTFALGAGERIAVSPDGKRGGICDSDTLHLFEGDRIGAEVPISSVFDPLIAPDGKTLLFRGYDGPPGGDYIYSLFAMPLTGGKVTKIKGTEGATSKWAVSKTGVLRLVVSHDPRVKTCIVEVSLATPVRVLRRHCPEGAGREEVFVELSPSGDWVAWRTHLAEERVHSMELATGAVRVEVADGLHHAINDRGHVVSYGPDRRHKPDSSTIRTLTGNDECRFRDDTTLVCVHGNAIVTHTIAAP